MTDLIDWRALRDIAQNQTSNGSGFHQIQEDAWREFAKNLAHPKNKMPFADIKLIDTLQSALRLARTWVATCTVTPKARKDILVIDAALRQEIGTCTCISDLEDDAYEPGGPKSGHPRPPACVIHKKNPL